MLGRREGRAGLRIYKEGGRKRGWETGSVRCFTFKLHDLFVGLGRGGHRLGMSACHSVSRPEMVVVLSVTSDGRPFRRVPVKVGLVYRTVGTVT